VQAFHKFLGHEFVLASENYEQFHELFERCAKRSYRTVFSHGDLAPRNILVKDGRVVGIIDWETAGWYPEYWEYARLKRSNLDAPDWEERLCKLMDPYLDEEKAEDALSSIFTRCWTTRISPDPAKSQSGGRTCRMDHPPRTRRSQSPYRDVHYDVHAAPKFGRSLRDESFLASC
jgi:aminoglycoside phosphotransferase